MASHSIFYEFCLLKGMLLILICVSCSIVLLSSLFTLKNIINSLGFLGSHITNINFTLCNGINKISYLTEK